MADSDDVLAFLEVTVEGVNFAAQAVYVEVEDNDRLIDRAVVVLDDAHGAISDLPREGQSVKVDLGWMTEHAVMFEGEIVRVITEAFSEEARRVTLVAMDASYQLMQGLPKTRDHTGTLSSIAKTIVGEYSIPVGQVELEPDPEFTEEMPLRQVNKKDWAFLQDAASKYGARIFVEVNEGASKFYMVSESKLLQGDPMGELSYTGGLSELVEFRYQRVAASAAPVREAVTIDPDTGEVVTAAAPPPPTPEPAPAADDTRGTILDEAGGGLGDDYKTAFEQVGKANRKPEQQRPQTIVRGLPSDIKLPDLLTKVDPTRAMGLHGEGLAVGTVQLRAKGKVSITGIVNWAEGDWYVRQVQHLYADHNYWSRFVVTR
jgi:phage protein D